MMTAQGLKIVVYTLVGAWLLISIGFASYLGFSLIDMQARPFMYEAQPSLVEHLSVAEQLRVLKVYKYQFEKQRQYVEFLEVTAVVGLMTLVTLVYANSYIMKKEAHDAKE